MAVAEPRDPLVPDFEVMVDGSPVSAEVETHVVGLTVDDDVGAPSMLTLKLAGSDAQEEAGSWVGDAAPFALGQVVEVKMGYLDDLETVFIGEITGLEPEFAFDQLPSLTIRAFDRRHRLLRGRKTRTFVQQTDSDIAALIAQEAGLNAQVEASDVVHDYVVQVNQTDMAFLQERARRIHYEVVVEDKDLLFRPVGIGESERFTLTMDDDLLEFYPRLSTVRQLSQVQVRGWSVADKEAILGEANAGDETSTMGGQESGGTLSEGLFGAAVGGVHDRPVMTQAEADQIATARLNGTALALIVGEGVCWGRTDMRAGVVVKIDGLGSRFSGNYYVTAVIHRYQPRRGYHTRFTVRRNAS